MSICPYPIGIDRVWLASDSNGHVGAFIIAGVGPIPLEALESDYVPIEDIEWRLLELPLVSRAQLLISVKRPDDFVNLAERGIFVFDWTDIHRSACAALHLYEPVAVPTTPIANDSLPEDLASLTRIIRLTDAIFIERKTVHIGV